MFNDVPNEIALERFFLVLFEVVPLAEKPICKVFFPGSHSDVESFLAEGEAIPRHIMVAAKCFALEGFEKRTF